VSSANVANVMSCDWGISNVKIREGAKNATSQNVYFQFLTESVSQLNMILAIHIFN
jgi:hypothetical protein